MNYLTIDQASVHEIEIKKSRFLCYLYPLQDAADFPPILAALRKEHYKAAHHCSAYIIGPDSLTQKMSDDGEPAGTAGVPMLEVLKQRQLTNLAAVVVRYFGGIKLGAGGLIRAYSSAVSEALKQATIVANVNQLLIALELGYNQVDSFQYFLDHSDLDVTVMDTEYAGQVTYTLAIYQDQATTLEAQLRDRFNGQIGWLELGEETVNVPVKQAADQD